MKNKRHSRQDYEDYLNELFPTDYIIRKFKYMINSASDMALAHQGKYGTLLRKYDQEFFIQGHKHWAIKAEFEDFKARERRRESHVMPVVRISTHGKMHELEYEP